MNFEVVSPILGFEHVRHVELEKIDDTFAQLSTCEGVSWSLVNPFALRDYEFSLPLCSQILLQSNEDSQLEVYCMLVLHNPLERSMVHFASPFIFNLSNKKALQLALNAQDYPQFFVPKMLSDFVCH